MGDDKIFDDDTLMMLFDELYPVLGITFDQWVTSTQYNSSMTDREIYNLLPKDMLPHLGEFDLNASWFHAGM